MNTLRSLHFDEAGGQSAVRLRKGHQYTPTGHSGSRGFFPVTDSCGQSKGRPLSSVE